MKTRKIKASQEVIDDYNDGWRLPVWTLPRTPQDYDQMVEQASHAKVLRTRLAGGGHVMDEEIVGQGNAIAVLKALGITRPKENKTK